MMYLTLKERVYIRLFLMNIKAVGCVGSDYVLYQQNRIPALE